MNHHPDKYVYMSGKDSKNQRKIDSFMQLFNIQSLINPFPPTAFPEVFFSLWSHKRYPNFGSLGMLGFKLLPELISAILSIYVTLTTPTN